MIRIISNGSKWAGETPDSVADLLLVLAAHPLDRKFEEFGNFVNAAPLTSASPAGYDKNGKMTYHQGPLIYPDHPETARFFGNFAHLSHVFTIDTDEPEFISVLTAAIRANQKRPDYATPSKRLMA